jgi:protein-tyrosine phosphatase
LPPFRDPPRRSFERVANFRDLGGHTTRDGRRVRYGRLYRSGHLAHCSDADVALLSEIGLRVVFDFRTRADIEKEGADRLPPGTEHRRLPMPDPAASEDIRTLVRECSLGPPGGIERVFGDGGAERLMMRSAARLVTERTAPYGLFLAELARPEALPALFHCSAGKDRAGWAGTVVLLALGVDEAEAVEQYLLSNRDLERTRERLRSEQTADFGDLLSPLLEVRVEYLQSSLDALQREWGNFDAYLHEGLGISEAQRAQLAENLLA